MIPFAHIRYKTKDGNIAPHGGITYAYELDDNNKVIGYAKAKCHERDMFCKQQGRVKALGRMKSPRYFKEVNMDKNIFFDMINVM